MDQFSFVPWDNWDDNIIGVLRSSLSCWINSSQGTRSAVSPLWIRAETSPAYVIVLLLNQRWKQRINNYLLKFFILFGNIIGQSNWVTVVFPFVTGFMRHPFFLSPACTIVCTNSEQTAPSASGSASQGGSLGQRCPGPLLLPGAASCKLLVWLKGNVIPSWGDGSREERLGGRKCSCTWWPRTRTGLLKVMLKKELVSSSRRAFLQVRSRWGCSVS